MYRPWLPARRREGAPHQTKPGKTSEAASKERTEFLLRTQYNFTSTSREQFFDSPEDIPSERGSTQITTSTPYPDRPQSQRGQRPTAHSTIPQQGSNPTLPSTEIGAPVGNPFPGPFRAQGKEKHACGTGKVTRGSTEGHKLRRHRQLSSPFSRGFAPAPFFVPGALLLWAFPREPSG